MERNEEIKTVIVLGAPRGGTSATAGVLSLLGVDLGDMRASDRLNPRGYYEDSEILELCDELFELAEPGANGFSPPSKEAIRRVGAEMKTRAGRILQAKMEAAEGQCWGWKATATCYLAEAILPWVNNPYFVVVTRNLHDVAKSMVEYTDRKVIYDGLSLREALGIGAGYYHAIGEVLERSSDVPCVIVGFEDLLGDPSGEARRIAGFLELEVDEKTLGKIETFVARPGQIKREKRGLGYIEGYYGIVKSIIGAIKSKFQ